MDRFEWCDGQIQPGESFVTQQTGVGLYDGDHKTSFNFGILSLTTHRVLWRDRANRNCVLGLPLSLVVFTEQVASGFTKSAKIVVHLNRSSDNKKSGPVSTSTFDYVRFSFKESGECEFSRCLQEQLEKKLWQQSSQPASSQSKKRAAGIVGIERTIQQRNQATSKDISQAFQDLSKLIDKAKEMVTLSKSIATKIKEKQGDITEDETVKFKSYLLSMGIPDPVTRESHGTGTKYYIELARQIASVIGKPLEDCGGMMTLTDVYCRLNRARGMELLSPEDLLNACDLINTVRSSVRFKEFDSGVMVLQLNTHSEEEVIQQTNQQVEIKGSLTAEEYSQLIGISVILSKERLLLTEKAGKLCRDETVEGLRFYPNLFMTQTSSQVAFT